MNVDVHRAAKSWWEKRSEFCSTETEGLVTLQDVTGPSSRSLAKGVRSPGS